MAAQRCDSMYGTVMGGCRNGPVNYWLRRPRGSARGGRPFRWCLSGPPIREDWDADPLDDIRVDVEPRPCERVEFKIWHQGSTYTVEAFRPVDADEDEEARVMVESAFYAINKDRGEAQ